MFTLSCPPRFSTGLFCTIWYTSRLMAGRMAKDLTVLEINQ